MNKFSSLLRTAVLIALFLTGLLTSPADARDFIELAQMDTLNQQDACLKPVKSYRWKLVADKLERKLKGVAKSLSTMEKKQWEDDIAAVREAEKNGLPNPDATDASSPHRYLDRLTTDEQIAINRAFGDFYYAVTEKCDAEKRKIGTP